LRQALDESLAIIRVDGRNLTDLVSMLHVGTWPRSLRDQVNHGNDGGTASWIAHIRAIRLCALAPFR
jgi:hypothetical protein